MFRRAESATWSTAAAPSLRIPRCAWAMFFNMEPRFWLNLQSEYDMRMAVREMKEKIAPGIRTFHPEAA